MSLENSIKEALNSPTFINNLASSIGQLNNIKNLCKHTIDDDDVIKPALNKKEKMNSEFKMII